MQCSSQHVSSEPDPHQRHHAVSSKIMDGKTGKFIDMMHFLLMIAGHLIYLTRIIFTTVYV
jgi:hypothetical protein